MSPSFFEPFLFPFNPQRARGHAVAEKTPRPRSQSRVCAGHRPPTPRPALPRPLPADPAGMAAGRGVACRGGAGRASRPRVPGLPVAIRASPATWLAYPRSRGLDVPRRGYRHRDRRLIFVPGDPTPGRSRRAAVGLAYPRVQGSDDTPALAAAAATRSIPAPGDPTNWHRVFRFHVPAYPRARGSDKRREEATDPW